VPPIEGADFSLWQNELGAKALPNGLNTFPIEQLGLEVDRMLSINADNCARFKTEFTDPWTTMSNVDLKGFSQTWPDLGAIITEKGASLSQFCDYINWADISGVALTVEEANLAAIRIQNCD
jgi:hypothetical protein